MTELQNIIKFLNTIGLKTIDNEINYNESLDIIDENNQVVGQIKYLNGTLYIEASTIYGSIVANCEEIIEQKHFFLRPNLNLNSTIINFSFKDKRIDGTYKISPNNTSCQFKMIACGNNITINLNGDDSIFSFTSHKKSGFEEFSIKEDGKIVYCVANGIYDSITKSFPFISTVTINKIFGFEKKIKAKTIITDRNCQIYNKEKVYNYDNLLENEFDIISITNADILWRIEYLRQLIGEDLFNRIATSCLDILSEEEYKKLFEKHKAVLAYQNARLNTLDNPKTLKLSQITNKKSS